MKHILTILSLLITSISFAQVDTFHVKVKNDGSSVDSNFVNNKLAEKLDISDTTGMLDPYLQKIDTTNKWINVSDTASMLSPYISTAVANATYATITALNNKADKATTLNGYGITDGVRGAGSFNTLARFTTNSDGRIIGNSIIRDDGISVGINVTPAVANGSLFVTNTFDGGSAVGTFNYSGVDGSTGIIGYSYVTTTNGSIVYGVKGIAANQTDRTGTNVGGYFNASGTSTTNLALWADAGTVRFSTVPNAIGDYMTINGSGDVNRRTAAQTLTDIGALSTTIAASTYATISNLALKANISNAVLTGKTSINKLSLVGIKEYNDDSTAYFVGGLRLNDVYKTGNLLKIVSKTYDIGFDVNITDTVTVQFQTFSTGSNMGYTINWGDNTIDTVAATGRFQQPSHKYMTAGTFPISLYNFNDSTIVQAIDFGYGLTLKKVVSLNYLYKLPNLFNLILDGSTFADSTKYAGVSKMTNLTSLSLYNCGLTTFKLASIAPSVTSINLRNNYMSVSAVNDVLVWLDAQTFDAGAKELDIRQATPATPSGAGATAVTSLTSKGWTITSD